jgi:hypothetical protein
MQYNEYMDKTSPTTARSLKQCLKKGTMRQRCRVSCLRTIGTVRRALLTWYRCHRSGSGFFPDFSPHVSSCGELSKAVRQFLSESSFCVSEEERMSFQSIKKLLPPSCKCQEAGFLTDLADRLTTEGGPLPPDYLHFVREVSSSLFPKGWDVGVYEHHCYQTSPPLSSTLESSRRQGGGMSGSFDQLDFLDAALSGDVDSMNNSALMMLVQSAGKPRPLTKFSSEQLLLKPLHKTIYDRLSLNKWLSRGEVTAEVLERAGFSQGRGFLTSGDYKSATDGLRIEVAEEILKAARRTSISCPSRVWDFALRSLRPSLFLDQRSYLLGEGFEPVIGQMMGSLLSFPLLCVQNYSAFRYAQFSFFNPTKVNLPLRRLFRKINAPLLINGDDILFQSDPAFSRFWTSFVGELGLTVELTKTSFSKSFGTINSCLVRWRSGKLLPISTLRLGMLREPKFPNCLPRSFDQFLANLPRHLRYSAGVEFFVWHRQILKRTHLAMSEIGFSGSLALRCAKRAGLLSVDVARARDFSLGRGSLPPEPSPHNIILDREDVTMIEEGFLGGELAQLNGYEMASFKWKLRGSFSYREQAVRYWMLLSRPGPGLQLPDRFTWSRLTHQVGWEFAEVRRRFLLRRDDTRSCPVFSSLVLLFREMEDDILPAYRPFPTSFVPYFDDKKCGTKV